MRTCCKCNNQIPEGRIKALPNVRTCVNCSTTEAVACHVVVTGKTEYSQIEIVDQATARRMKELGSRTGFGVASGVKFQFESRKS
jgi:trans-2-enoyl-CoA reductase